MVSCVACGWFPRLSASTLFPYTTLFRSRFEPRSVSRGGDGDDNESRPPPGPAQHRGRRLRPVTTELVAQEPAAVSDRKSTRPNSSHANTSYAVFCLKKKISAHPAASSAR